MKLVSLKDKVIELDDVENPVLKKVISQRTKPKFHFWYTDSSYHESSGYEDHSERYSDYSDSVHTDNHRDRHRDQSYDHQDYETSCHNDQYLGHTDRGHSDHSDYWQKR